MNKIEIKERKKKCKQSKPIFIFKATKQKKKLKKESQLVRAYFVKCFFVSLQNVKRVPYSLTFTSEK